MPYDYFLSWVAVWVCVSAETFDNLWVEFYYIWFVYVAISKRASQRKIIIINKFVVVSAKPIPFYPKPKGVRV